MPSARVGSISSTCCRRRSGGASARNCWTSRNPSSARLQLWTFQRNAQVRRFYESRGFVLVEETDGAGNEEREPDARYLWSRGGA
jgi:hypothetical protein